MSTKIATTSQITRLWTTIGRHIIIGKGVAQVIPESGLKLLLTDCQTHSDPTALLLSIRQNPDIPTDVYPTMAEISPEERVPALITLSVADRLPLADLAGIFQGNSITFRCFGSSFEAKARQLLDHSATLRAAPEVVLSSPQALFSWLSSQRPTIAAELGGQTHSVSYLVQALNAHGKITQEETFLRLASANDLYEKSTTLQSVPSKILNDPVKVIEWVQQNKSKIETETGSSNLALATLINALMSAGVVSSEQKYLRFAGARDLHERSAILKTVPQKTLKDPIEVVNWLKDNRTQIEREGSEESLSIGYLVEALIAAQKTPFAQEFTRMASALELYLRSSILQAIPASVLTDPVEIIDWLFNKRNSIKKEAGKGDNLALVTLLNALQAAKVIALRQDYQHLAGAREIYEASPILQAIPKKILKKPIQVVDWLYKRRTMICEETERDSLALGTLIHALQAAKILPRHQRYERLASGRDFYDRSQTLQSIPSKILDNTLDLIDWMVANRSVIAKEASQKDSISLGTIMESLIASKKVSLTSNAQRIVASRDFYEKTSLLHNGPATFSTVEETIIFIDQIKDQLTSLKEREQEESSGRVSFVYVIDALTSARRISPDIRMQKLRFEAAAADYARRNIDLIKPKITMAATRHYETLPPQETEDFDPEIDKRWTTRIDRSGFISLDGKKHLSARYIRTILKWALILYGYQEARNAII